MQLEYFSSFKHKIEGTGTAFLIAHNVALTAAHNIYMRDSNLVAEFVTLIMEFYTRKEKKYRAVCAYVPR